MTNMWSKVKAVTGANENPEESDEDEVSKALRDYYANKGGPMPEFLKPKAEERVDEDNLDKFSSRFEGRAPPGRQRERGYPSPPGEPDRRRDYDRHAGSRDRERMARGAPLGMDRARGPPMNNSVRPSDMPPQRRRDADPSRRDRSERDFNSATGDRGKSLDSAKYGRSRGMDMQRERERELRDNYPVPSSRQRPQAPLSPPYESPATQFARPVKNASRGAPPPSMDRDLRPQDIPPRRETRREYRDDPRMADRGAPNAGSRVRSKSAPRAEMGMKMGGDRERDERYREMRERYMDRERMNAVSAGGSGGRRR
ncbi:hypothetical protein BKA69DRAFT_1043539 [Paraphysoderma sedebokerense]|nr:hypothetical protein BKA69DRAFT_1043539 [Paraphysoderma sedebokerense]